MKNYETKEIRNIAIVGHGGEGKTTLTEAMLFSAGGTDRFGRVEDGTTTTDYDPEEIKRTISISSALAPLEWNNHKINVIDVPGYFDFVGEMLGALRVVDSAVLVVGAVSGLMVGTEKAWDYCESHVIPRMVFINQMDRENANFSRVLDQLKDKYGTSIAPFQIPIMEGGEFKGFVDALRMNAKIFDGKKLNDAPIPESMMDEVEPIRTMLVEAAVETSEELMEKYFEGEEITIEELTSAVRQGVLDGDIVPILCGSAVNNVGVGVLLDEVVNFLPSPCDRPSFKGTNPKTEEEIRREMKVDEPFSALVFKTIVDPFVGKLSIFKVMSGELNSGATVYNANKDTNEKTTALYMLKGKKQNQITKDIVVVSGVEGNLIPSRGSAYCPYHIQGLIPVKWSNLYGHHSRYPGKVLPELIG
jgi:elongation factor G